jgi:hypothetical protein
MGGRKRRPAVCTALEGGLEGAKSAVRTVEWYDDHLSSLARPGLFKLSGFT